MLGVDERTHSAQLLRLGQDVVDERRLPRRLGAEDLDDAPSRDAANSKRNVQWQCPRGDSVHGDPRARVAHAHDSALAELLLDLVQGALEGSLTLCVRLGIGRGARFLVLAHRAAAPCLMRLNTSP